MSRRRDIVLEGCIGRQDLIDLGVRRGWSTDSRDRVRVPTDGFTVFLRVIDSVYRKRFEEFKYLVELQFPP